VVRKETARLLKVNPIFDHQLGLSVVASHRKQFKGFAQKGRRDDSKKKTLYFI
jgi:hypothetical protein